MPRRINVQLLKNPEVQTALSDKLDENLENVHVNDDLEKSWILKSNIKASFDQNNMSKHT